jgi:hypothetical protein
MTVNPRHDGLTLSTPNIIARAYEGSAFWVEKNRQLAGLFGENMWYTEVRKSSSPKILAFCSLQGSKNGGASAETAQGRRISY